MKNKFNYLIFTFIAILFAILNTNLITNIWMVLTDNTNYMPTESNIIFFTPTQIDDGSGGYWRYGKDLKNYYYFSVTESDVYYFISKGNSCPRFSEINFQTWCEINKKMKQ